MSSASAAELNMAAPSSSSEATAILLTGLVRRYNEVNAVPGIDLSIAVNEFFSLIGPSGWGKTTTLRMVAGLETPTSGSVYVGGTDVTRLPAYRRPVNTVFQDYALFPHLNVFENIAFGLRERRVGRQDVERRVRQMLEMVGLAGREQMRCKQLSRSWRGRRSTRRPARGT
jgi:ABC-type Fe3+/spermidine/putrescine transport system ATPase subunit